MKKILLSSFLIVTSVTSLADSTQTSLPGTFSGEASIELRNYSEAGVHEDQPWSEGSFVLKPQYSYAWDQDRKVISFIPYARLNSVDEEKTHFDIRELSFVGSYQQFEVRAGISKVFWGVTESQHLVDVINQTDFVENPDGEDKLGQPMVNLTYVSNYGNVDFFVLPFFRERTFSGLDGRFRNALEIDTNDAIYLEDEKDKYIDRALRWSHYYQDLEWAVSYFKGTDRDPGFTLKNGKLRPTYGLSEQFGLELQYVYTDWLFKAEGIKKDSDIHGDYHASVTGFEYTFGNVYGGKDIGLLYEWQWDERNKENPTGASNASFAGVRLAVNDEASTELLAGGMVNNDDGHYISTRVEASRRLGQDYKIEFELNIIDSPPENTSFDSVKDDDYTQLTFSYFW